MQPCFLNGGGNIKPAENSMNKMKRTRREKDLRKIFPLLLGWAFIAASAISICIYCRQSKKEALIYQKIAEAGKVGQAGESRLMTEGEEELHNTEKEAAEGEKETEKEQIPEKKQKTDTRLFYDWGELISINENVIGWLCIPDTLIDFPVVGAEDNSFYLSHDFSGNESRSGCLFMDKDTEMIDFNRVIYGHNMGRGSEAMFSTLLCFKEKAYFDKYRYFCFTETGKKTSVYMIIAVVKYDVKDAEEWDFRVRNHATEEECRAFMKEIRERALYYREEPEPPQRLMMLATCDRSEYGKDGRFLVIGVS